VLGGTVLGGGGGGTVLGGGDGAVLGGGDGGAVVITVGGADAGAATGRGIVVPGSGMDVGPVATGVEGSLGVGAVPAALPAADPVVLDLAWRGTDVALVASARAFDPCEMVRATPPPASTATIAAARMSFLVMGILPTAVTRDPGPRALRSSTCTTYRGPLRFIPAGVAIQRRSKPSTRLVRM
jgi:hypothetical protein